MFVNCRIRFKRADRVHADNCAEPRENSSTIEQSAHSGLGSIRARYNLETAHFKLLQRSRDVRIGRQPQILVQQIPQGFFPKRNIQLSRHKSQRLRGANVEIFIFLHQCAPERIFDLFAAPQFRRFSGPRAKNRAQVILHAKRID